MADEEEVVVTIADDAEVKKDTPVVDPAVAELKAQYEELTRKDAAREQQLQSERQKREEAQRATEEARKQTATAQTTVAETQLDAVESGKRAAEVEAEAATAEYQSAMEAGDFAKAAKAQRKISAAEYRIGRYDEAKADLEATKAAPKVEPQQQERQQPSDPVEAFLASRTDATRQWLRSRPEDARALALSMVGTATGDDVKRGAKLNAAHSDAIAEGLKPDSPEYFAHVEKFIGVKDNAQKPPQQRRQSAPVAPVNGNSSSSSNGFSGNDVTLSKREAAAATDGTLRWNYDDPSGQKKFRKGDVIGVQEFARRKLEMQRQGLYDKSYTES